jgi:phosphoribosylformimino-5-aminoimidazole carboxamide ribotide isomerase
LYRKHNLTGGHVIKLGPGNDAAAKEALAAWKNGLHVAGGINEANALEWIEAGAEKVKKILVHVTSLVGFGADDLSSLLRKVIVTSYLFPGAKFSLERLRALSATVGKDRLVVDVR